MMIDFDLSTFKELKKIDKKIDYFRKKIKDSEDFKVKDEVFDTSTLMALYRLASKGYIDALGGSVSTGKEANIFHAVRKLNHRQQELAIKIYRISTGNFRAMQEYLIGDIRFKKIRHTKKSIILAWTRKEFRNLSRAKECGLNVPRPIITDRNILIMEFMGKNNVPYPRLREYDLLPEQAEVVFEKIEEFMVRLFRDAELVHGDLSEYNILMESESLNPIFIDMGQAVTLDHPNAMNFLSRDASNIVRFINKFGLSLDKEILLSKIINSKADH